MIRRSLALRRRLTTAVSLALFSVAFAPAAHASGSSMPWEQPLNQILQSIEGLSDEEVANRIDSMTD